MTLIKNIGDEITTENYHWSDNKRDAIGKTMADYLNMWIKNSDAKMTLLEVKETSMKIENYYKGVRNVVRINFISK